MEYGKLIGEGRQAKVYEWGRNEIIKIFDSSVLNSDIENEYKKSIVAYELGIPSPYVKEIVDINGKRGIVYEKLVGSTLLKTMKNNVFKIKKSIQMVAENHVKLSKYNTNELPDIKKIIKDSMNRIDENILDEDKKKLINDYIDRLPEINGLCHVDFHPDNIIITKSGPKIIDWCNAASGDPCADAAVTAIIFTLCNNPPGTGKVINVLSKVLARYMKKVYINQYCKLAQKTVEEINKWMLPAAVLRLSYNLPEERKELVKIINSMFK